MIGTTVIITVIIITEFSEMETLDNDSQSVAGQTDGQSLWRKRFLR